MFKKVLIPVDGSQHSKKALEYAMQLCKGRESECSFTLMHVNPFIHYWGGELIAIDVNIEDKILEESENLIKPVAKTVLNAGIHCDSIISTGDPAQEIVNKAKKDQYDLIVMGSRGLGSFSELVLGSVSHKVVQHAACPVLIVK